MKNLTIQRKWLWSVIVGTFLSCLMLGTTVTYAKSHTCSCGISVAWSAAPSECYGKCSIDEQACQTAAKEKLGKMESWKYWNTLEFKDCRKDKTDCDRKCIDDYCATKICNS